MTGRNMRAGFHQKMLVVVQQKTYIFFCPPFFCHIFLQKLVTLGKMPALPFVAAARPRRVKIPLHLSAKIAIATPRRSALAHAFSDGDERILALSPS